MVFSREKHTSCWTGDKNQAFCHTHLAGGPYLHTLVHAPPHPLSLFWPLSFGASPLCPLLFPALSLPPPSLRPFLVLSQDALMSAHTCCHIPPVPSSARHDRIQLNSTAAGRARNKPEYIKGAGRKQRGGWDGTTVNIAWTGDLHVPRILCPPNLDDTMTNGLILPGSSSPPLWAWCGFDPNSNNGLYVNIWNIKGSLLMALKR